MRWRASSASSPTTLRLQQPGASRADAVRQHHQAAFRLRRLSRGPAAGHRAPSASTRCASASNSGEPDGAAHRHRLCHVLRAGRSRHQRLCRLGHSVRAGPRAVLRPASRPMAALELRIGAHSHGQGLETTLSQVAHSILGVPHDRIRLVHGDTARDALLDRHLGLALHDHVGRCRGRRLRRAGRTRDPDRRRRCCRPSREEVRARRAARSSARRVAWRSPRWRAPGIAGRRICRPTSNRRGLEVTAGYKAKRDTGTFSYAAHAAVVAVDPEHGRGRDPRLRRRRGRRRAGQSA